MNQNKQLIYVIEDEEDIAELIRYNLTLEGYDVRVFASGESGLEGIQNQKPDLVVLDLMLPGLSGLEICRSLKSDKNFVTVPLIMVTAKGEESDVVRGLELGADDYLSKPFSPRVLIARIKSILRRSRRQELLEGLSDSEQIKVGNLEVHQGRHEALIAGAPVQLTNSEFKILAFLVQRPGWVFTRSQIVNAIRGEGYAVTDRTIDFQMVGLRRKLGELAPYIETVRGVGYRFKEV